MLSQTTPEDRHLVASGIVSAFKSLWHDSWGPRLEYILHNAISALAHCPNTSLLGLNRLLTDPAYRRWVVNQVTDPFLRDFWENEYESWEPRFMREAIAPIQNKAGQLLLSPVIRNIIGQVRNKVSIPFVMDEGRIFIANLSKGEIGHDKSNLLGSLLITQFQLAAMARNRQPEHQRRDFYLFVDEFQNFATESFTSILAEARKYRLNLTLSHQYIAQLSPALCEMLSSATSAPSSPSASASPMPSTSTVSSARSSSRGNSWTCPAMRPSSATNPPMAECTSSALACTAPSKPTKAAATACSNAAVNASRRSAKSWRRSWSVG